MSDVGLTMKFFFGMSNEYKIRQQERQSVFGMKICAI